MAASITLTGRERTFPESEIIVSKTDVAGRITYVNDVFQEVSGYGEAEVMGQPHSIIRHPDMPRCVFKLLWDVIQAGNEIFAYVNNRAKNGDHYWVLAHVTPSYDPGHQLIGYHSSRRSPRREAVARIQPIYDLLLQEERKLGNSDQGMALSLGVMRDYLRQAGIGYEEFVLGL
ncbi:aerotaxis receptor [mine drainage metagenome]|uniref:Aerotaxis receptor n=1 Tax=mine drainage metagenome TaxID=410659 RepID=A0A1J5R609_9ZZZZ